MPILTVGPTSTYASIAQAMIHAVAGDIISLQAGYCNETATVTKNNMTVTGDASSTGIVIQIGTTAPAIATFTLAGTAPINILDSPQGNGLVGNAGNNVITVTDGSDAVNGGLGIDRLVVDYHLATGAVTGDSTSNFAEAGGSRLVSITAGTFENFTVLTGSGADTLTVGNGDNIIRAGNGANTITAGNGANSITGGSGADTITAGDGGNSIDAGNGTNTITSGSGNDVILSGVGADTIVAGGGNDVITLRGGADNVKSGAGFDRLVVNYSASTTAVIGGVTGGNLGSGYTGHIADSVGNLVDFVSTEAFTITTGSGNDSLTVGGGDDTLTSGAGNDTIRPGLGNDTVNAGTGNDGINFTGGQLTAADKIDGGAGTDTVLLNSSYTGANSVTFNATTMVNVETLTLSAGHSYALTTNNATVAAGKTLTINGAALSASTTLAFNGSADTDGHFIIIGGLGADKLTGGALSDTFVYTSAAQSTSTHYDKINGFNFSSDIFDIPGAVGTITGINAKVTSGSLSTATFDANLTAAISSGHLGAHHAVLFTPTAGTLSGDTFLVVDLNGMAGYQTGADLVINMKNGTSGILAAAGFH
jgi:Ca2+-binding RTX toxin-like protein